MTNLRGREPPPNRAKENRIKTKESGRTSTLIRTWPIGFGSRIGEPGYFYLDAEDTDLPEDSVAFLNLSIAIKTNLHLQTCIDAKVLQLTDTFQAKLGWLVGQMYSRVGTPDMDADKARKKITAALQTVALWVDETKIKVLESRFAELSQTEPNKVMSPQEIAAALKAVPNLKQLVIKRATEILTEALGAGEEAVTRKLSSRLSNVAALTKLLK